MMKQAKYGNWVPETMFKALAAELLMVIVMALVAKSVLHSAYLFAFWCAVLVGSAVFTLYMWICHEIFAFGKGGLMGKLHDFLLDHLPWDGQGVALDIGCGSGALTIRAAKRYSAARFIGMDFWGKEWSYAQSQCQENARAEGVAVRTMFEVGDAAQLKYRDDAFSAVMSNFVFHEVKSMQDKRELVREALRVLKPGGAFALQDMFGQEKLYGDMDEFVEFLKQEGIHELHYIPDVDKQSFVPRFVRAPWMIQKAGLLYGIK